MPLNSPSGGSRPGPSAPAPGTFFVEVDAVVGATHARVRVLGELDLATAGLLAAPLAAVAAGGHRRLDLDVAGVPFCDLAGLDVLLATHAQLTARGGDLVLHSPCPSLRQLLAVLALTSAFVGSPPPPRAGGHRGDDAPPLGAAPGSAPAEAAHPRGSL